MKVGWDEGWLRWMLCGQNVGWEECWLGRFVGKKISWEDGWICVILELLFR